jgi:hypothetical protein
MCCGDLSKGAVHDSLKSDPVPARAEDPRRQKSTSRDIAGENID